MSAAGLLVAGSQVLLVTVGAPVLAGLVGRVRARLEGRAGPSVLQPWRDLRKLLAKERIAPEHSSWIFPLAPVVLVATTVLVTAIVPVVTTATPLADAGDLFAVVYLLLLGAVMLALAGLDPGTAFGGMGSSREVTIAALAEPTVLLAIFALAARAGSTSVSAIVGATLADPRVVLAPSGLLALAAFGVVVLAENGRLPIDNPTTHLELTMVHEAMILEYAGPDLALVEFAAHLRLTVFLVLLANLFLPWGIATGVHPGAMLVGTAVIALKVGLLGVALAFFETATAKLRLFRVPELLAGSFLLALLAVTASFFLT